MARALSKRSPEEHGQLRTAALLMRFRTATPPARAKKYLCYSDIAKVLRLSAK